MCKKIKIGKRIIGEGERPYIILEAGSNWLDLDHEKDVDYNLNMAKRMIEEARRIGADAIKFQTFKAEEIVSKKGPTPAYLKKISRETLFDIFKRLSMPREWLPELAEHCRRQDITFLSTAFDCEALDILVERCKIPAIKISSFEITDLSFLRYAAKKGLPIIISTGMADIQDIMEAREVIISEGNDNLIFLHCVIEYPARPLQMNLKRMDTIRQITQSPVGLSDHSMEIWIPAVAIARGACIVEKHFTLSRNQRGPDHGFALEVGEAEQMIKMAGEAYQALGSPLFFRPRGGTAGEMYRIERRCLTVARPIKKGDILKEEDFKILRGNGILPRDMDKVVGKIARRDFEVGEIFTWNDL